MQDQEDAINAWWDGLSEDERADARACVEEGPPSAKMLKSLANAGIYLPSGQVGSQGKGATFYIPNYIADFVRRQPE